MRPTTSPMCLRRLERLASRPSRLRLRLRPVHRPAQSRWLARPASPAQPLWGMALSCLAPGGHKEPPPGMATLLTPHTLLLAGQVRCWTLAQRREQPLSRYPYTPRTHPRQRAHLTLTPLTTTTMDTSTEQIPSF